MNCVIKTSAAPYAFPSTEAPCRVFRKTIKGSLSVWTWNLRAGLPLPFAICHLPFAACHFHSHILTRIHIDTFYDPSADVSLVSCCFLFFFFVWSPFYIFILIPIFMGSLFCSPFSQLPIGLVIISAPPQFWPPLESEIRPENRPVIALCLGFYVSQCHMPLYHRPLATTRPAIGIPTPPAYRSIRQTSSLVMIIQRFLSRAIRLDANDAHSGNKVTFDNSVSIGAHRGRGGGPTPLSL